MAEDQAAGMPPAAETATDCMGSKSRGTPRATAHTQSIPDHAYQRAAGGLMLDPPPGRVAAERGRPAAGPPRATFPSQRRHRLAFPRPRAPLLPAARRLS